MLPSALLTRAYLTMAVIGLVGTWYFAIADSGTGYAPPDLLLLSALAAVFIAAEGWRQRTGHLWAYLVAIPILGAAFAVPIFLYVRERELARRAQVLHAELLAR